MKFNAKKKKGNVILPVVGTIAALTILAGSAVGFALNSNKIVYKESHQFLKQDLRKS